MKLHEKKFGTPKIPPTHPQENGNKNALQKICSQKFLEYNFLVIDLELFFKISDSDRTSLYLTSFKTVEQIVLTKLVRK
jgi:hypothetical protein